MKIGATVLGVFVVAGIAFAAIRLIPRSEPASSVETDRMNEQKMMMEDTMKQEASSGGSMDSADAMMQGDQMEKADDEMMMKKEDDGAMMNPPGDEMMKDEQSMMKQGSYETYAPEKLAQANGGDVVLFFRASWCPTCRALDADIRSHLTDIPSNLTILDVNYDDFSALKQKYGVTYQHTLVQVDAEGNQITKWSGSPTLATLVAQVK